MSSRKSHIKGDIFLLAPFDKIVLPGEFNLGLRERQRPQTLRLVENLTDLRLFATSGAPFVVGKSREQAVNRL